VASELIQDLFLQVYLGLCWACHRMPGMEAHPVGILKKMAKHIDFSEILSDAPESNPGTEFY
jgi:hypothetical protein